MISLAIWYDKHINFSKITNPTCPAGSCNFVEKFISAYLRQIALEIMLLPILNVSHTKLSDG